MTEPAAARVEALFRASGALREGHFQLKSGRHGTSYLEKFQVLQHPAAVSELCGMVAAHVTGADGQPDRGRRRGTHHGRRHPGLRDGPPAGRCPASSPRRCATRPAGRSGPSGAGFRLEPGQRVLLVDDILTTGGSLLAMLPPIEAAGAELVAAVVLVDRAGGTTSVTSPTSGRSYPVTALWVLDLPTYAPGSATCPACASDLPLEAPGSSGL